jgi:diaminopimelate decarboxylase
MTLEPDELAWLAREVGDAFYLLDLDVIRGAHDELRDAFRRRYPATTVAYSVKTNYTPRILSLVRELGCLAEVVSEMEYELVSRVGFAPGEILVNGPLHEAGFLDRILRAGARINLDGWYMLDALHEVSRACPDQRFRVGLRLNHPLPDTDWSRFGFEAGADNLRRLAAWFEDHPNCAVAGLHGHYPLAPHRLEVFEARIRALADAARTWFPKNRLDYLDLGGGLYVEPGDPGLGEVADRVAGVLEERFAPAERPELIVEPGSALVRDAMAFVCRVYDVKTVAGRTLALVNGSVHHFNTMMWHSRPEVRVVRRSDQTADPGGVFDVVGSTCMERKDLIRTGVPGPVSRGDSLVFPGIGAYSCALKPPFIHTCPPVVARQGGGHTVVKRRETVDDVLSTYVL